MATNAFEDSRISEGTLQVKAQHVANLPATTASTPRAWPGREILNGHPIRTPNLHRVVGSATLAGSDVRNPAGESLGKIEDLMIDLSRGRVAYAILSFGGLFGVGGKFFILPWSALVFDGKRNEFILDIDREVLEKGPGFEKDQWPDMADPVFGSDIHRYYGKTPYWQHTLTNFGGEELTANRCCE